MHLYPLAACGVLVTAMLCVTGGAGDAAPAPSSGGPEAAPRLPDGPAARRLEEYAARIQAGDAVAAGAFVRESFSPEFLRRIPAERHVRMILDVGRDTGGVRLLRILRASDTEIAAVCSSLLTEQEREIQVEVEPQPPHRILSLGVRPAEIEARKLGAKGIRPEQVARELDPFLKRLTAADRFSGSVLVARKGRPLYRRAFGLASKAWGVPNRVDTRFNLGSMNKMFTGVAIAQLAQAGRLRFQDPVGRFLPDFPNQDVRERVTLHHLLTHTSGLGSYFNPRFMDASRARFRTIQDYMPLVAEEELQFPPGSRWAYSNSGFLLLGAILEKVTGQSYFDYVREQIYRPAGMENSDAYELDRDTPNLAMGYTRMGPQGEFDPEGWRNNLFLHVIKGGPAGGGYSTVDDLHRFARALREHRLLDAAHTELLLAGKVDSPLGRYAYGFMDQRVGGARVVGHSGGFPGISSQLEIYLENGYTVAVLSNYDNGAEPVIEKLRRLLTRGK